MPLSTRPSTGRFVDGVKVLLDGTELHLASFCLADTELLLMGTDNSAFDELKTQYSDMLGAVPPGLPPDRCMELEPEKGDELMPLPRPVNRLSGGELAE